jgi:hypothetical protein
MKAHEDFMAWPELMIQLEQLQQAARAENVVAIRLLLRACVHGFHDEAV